MFRTIAILAIFTLCVSVAFGTTATPTTQSSTVGSSYLFSTYDKILSGTNTTEYTSTTWGLVPEYSGSVTFGPGAANTTIYAYGLVYSSTSTSITTIIRRSINATIAGNSSDTNEGAVIGDTSITASISVASVSSGFLTAVGPGYFALLNLGTVSSYSQVQVTIINPSGTLSTTTLTSNTGTATAAYTLGGIFYEQGSGVFFVTYSAKVSSTYSIYVQGVTASTAAAYWTSPLSITLVSTANSPSSLFIGGDNYTNASNIYVVFKDGTAYKTYYSKTAKASSTSSAGAATLLVADVTSGSYPYYTYLPIGVWASNYTYGIGVSVETTASSGATATYSITNFLNGSASTSADSGLTNISSATPSGIQGWPLTTGYTLAAVWTPTSGSGVDIVYGTFYANGTANMSATTLASGLQGPYNTFEDVNGTEWIGWTDIDTTNDVVYNLYIAKLQGQLNSASSTANALKTFMMFVALCLAAVFAL